MENDIYYGQGVNSNSLPKLPKLVVHKVYVWNQILTTQSCKYFSTTSRLTIYKFRFKNVRGTRRVIDESQK